MSAKQDKQDCHGILSTIGQSQRLKLIALFVIILLCVAGILISALLGYINPPIVFAVIIIVSIIYLLGLIRLILAGNKGEIDELRGNLDKKERFISDFSHLIRTPLNNFSLIIGLFDNAGLNEKQKELIETLTASTYNMVNVVNDLSMKTAQEISFEARKKIKLNLVTTLRNTIELYDLKSEGGTQINIHPGQELKYEYLSDPIAMKQIFLDLFDAMELKGTQNLKVDIGISVVKSRKDSDDVEFTFKTNKQVQFIRVTPDDHSEIQGHSARLISRLSGKYSASISSEGAVFTFHLPLTRASEETKPTEVAQRIKELYQKRRATKKLSEASILLVEDNPTNQKIVLISLRNKVKNIDTATNGKEALDMFGKSNYDLILMDVQLPVMDGITSVQKIRELESSTSKHTPIVAITANAMIGDKEKCLSAGMDEYLSKPFQPNQLLSLIEKLISG